MTTLKLTYAAGGVLAVIAIGYAVTQQYLPAAQAGYITVLIVLTGGASLRFFESMQSGGQMSIDSHWGGIGGGLGGWKISASLTYFLMTVALLALLGSILSSSPALNRDLEQERFASLVEKYYGALQVARQNKIAPHVRMIGDHLLITGQSPGTEASNALWNAIKAIDPQYHDIQVALGTPPAEASSAKK
jgi:hypothetical protein